MAYVFSGAYVPLSCKIMEQVLRAFGLLGLMGYLGRAPFLPCQLWLDSTLSQVLERKGWLGLEEVARLLGGHEFVTGKWLAGCAVPTC